MAEDQPFSWKWVLLSMAIFIATEIVLGAVVGGFVSGYASINFRILVQGLLNLFSYLAGGFVVGLVSPGKRIREPAVGAFLCVALTLLVAFLTPIRFLRFSTLRLIIGGLIAYALALAGAKIGEKLTGNG